MLSVKRSDEKMAIDGPFNNFLDFTDQNPFLVDVRKSKTLRHKSTSFFKVIMSYVQTY